LAFGFAISVLKPALQSERIQSQWRSVFPFSYPLAASLETESGLFHPSDNTRTIESISHEGEERRAQFLSDVGTVIEIKQSISEDQAGHSKVLV
jgi:hypothetical protein